MKFFVHFLCLVILSHLASCTNPEDEESERSYPLKRAIDGTRGRKYYDPEEDDPYNIYGSSNGQYNPYEEETDLSDIRNNVPGEPGLDYPAYMRLPQTQFLCEPHFRGYYADEESGCQLFHICDGSFLVSSFLCPIGSIFSQRLLTCDWWNKVDCSATRKYFTTKNEDQGLGQVDDDEILHKAFEMSVHSAGERIPIETVAQRQDSSIKSHNRERTNYDRPNQIPIETYSEKNEFSTAQPRHRGGGRENRRRFQDEDRYRESQGVKIHSNGENEERVAYSPTVPTIMTTARKFYSPTVPTTHRPTTRETFSKYDLEFESSDHLYSARGRSDKIKPATPSNNLFTDEDESKSEKPIETKSVSTSNEKSVSADFQNSSSINETISSLDRKEETIQQDLNRLSKEISESLSVLTIDENTDPNFYSYAHADSGDENSTNSQHSDQGPIKLFLQPPREEKSPFRITVLEENPPDIAEESVSRPEILIDTVLKPPSFSKIPSIYDTRNNTGDSPIIRIVLKNDFTEEETTTKKSVPTVALPISSKIGNSVENMTNPIEDFPSTTITSKTPENSIDIDAEATKNLPIVIGKNETTVNNSNSSNFEDSLEQASSPLQVTITVNKNEEIDPSGEEIRKLLEHQGIGDSIGAGDFKNLEIVPSDGRFGEEDRFGHETANSANEQKSLKIEPNEPISQRDRFRVHSSYLGNVLSFLEPPNFPRPFSVQQPPYKDLETNERSSNLREEETTIRSISSTAAASTRSPENNSESLQVSSSGFSRDLNNNAAILLQTARHFGESFDGNIGTTFDESVGENLDGNFGKKKEEKSRIELPERSRSLDFRTGLEIHSEESEAPIVADDPRDEKNNGSETSEINGKESEVVVQTEFIPSLSFSLNTDEEREEFMEAVAKGLLRDVGPTETIHHENQTSIPS